MTYTPTVWNNGAPPAIDKTNLDHIEGGIADAHALIAAIGGGGGAAPGVVFATPENFAGIDPTGATASDAGFTAAFAAANGYTLLVPPGTYLINSRITIADTTVRVSAHGAKFICGNNSTNEGSIFRFTTTMGTTRSVSGVVQAITSDGRFGSNGENMWVTSLTCTTTPSGITAGRWVKIAADDLLTDYQTGARSGQFARVVEVSGNVVVVAGKLRDPFTTTVRLALVNEAKVTWEGGVFEASSSILAGATGVGAPLQFRWLLFPEVHSVHATSLAGPFLDMRGCFGAVGRDITANWLQDASGSPGKYGYCVNDSSELSVYTGIRATRVRHAFTTGTTSVPAGNADLGNFGRCYGATVVDGWCYGATQTSWDTHGDANKVSFIDCVSLDSYSGFGMRGTENLVWGGAVRGEHPGGCMSVGTTSSSAYSWGTKFFGVTVDGITSPAVVSVSRDNGGVESRATYVDRIFVFSRNTSNPIILANYAAVQVGTIFVANGGVRNSATNGGTILPIPAEVPVTTTSNSYLNSGNGTAAATITNANSSTGGDAFSSSVTTSSGGGARTFETAASWEAGETGIRCTAPVSGVAMVGWTVPSRSMRVTGEVRFSANPTTEPSRFIELKWNAGATVACAVGRTTAGLPGIKGSGVSSTLSNTGATAVPLNTWMSFSLTVLGDSNNADGILEFALYTFPTSKVPFYSVIVTNLAMGMNGADFTDIRFGKPHTAPGEGNVDMKHLRVDWDVAGV